MLLGFKKRFVHPIQIGTKVHTIRGPRKIQPKIGETLHMYTCLRTNKCELISKKEKLIGTQKVRIWIYSITNYQEVKIWVDGRMLLPREQSKFVKFDGFDSVRDFADWWIKTSTGKKTSKSAIRVGGIFTIYHWTNLKY